MHCVRQREEGNTMTERMSIEQYRQLTTKRPRLTLRERHWVTNGTEDECDIIPEDWCLKLAFSWPPSDNHLYATVGNRRIMSKAGRAWQVNALRAIDVQLSRRTRLEYQQTNLANRLFDLTVWQWHPSPLWFDVDNFRKLVLDTLQKGGLYANDRQVMDLHLRKRWLRDPHALPILEVELRLWKGDDYQGLP